MYTIHYLTRVAHPTPQTAMTVVDTSESSLTDIIVENLNAAWEADTDQPSDWVITDDNHVVAMAYASRRTETSGLVTVIRFNGDRRTTTTYIVAYVIGKDGLYAETSVYPPVLEWPDAP